MSLLPQLAVRRNILMHPKQAAVTLNLADGTTTCAYPNAYGFPIAESSGLGSEAAAVQNAVIVLYQNGETYGPNVDDWISRGGLNYNIMSVQTSSNYSSGVAVHTCTCTRKA